MDLYDIAIAKKLSGGSGGGGSSDFSTAEVTFVSGNVTNNDGDLDVTGDCTIHYIGINIM